MLHLAKSRNTVTGIKLVAARRRVSGQFELFLSHDHYMRSDRFNTIAETINRIQVIYRRASKINQGNLETLNLSVAYANAQNAKYYIDNNTKIIESNISYQKLRQCM